jgi:oligogalacturonide lyase
MTGKEWTRRGFLASLAAAGAYGAEKKVHPFPAERVRYADPATEFPVTRLTSPKHSSVLPPAGHRVVSRRGTFLVFASDQSGSHQLMQMFLNTGEARQLTEAAALDPVSPALAADDRSVFFFDGPALKQFVFATAREAEIYRVPEGWSRGRGFNVSQDGARACLVETREGRWRLRMAPLRSKGEAVIAFEAPAPLGDPLPRPRHEDVLYRDPDGFPTLWQADQRKSRRLPLAPGRSGPAFWSSDGESLVYLSLPADRGQLNTIREWVAGSDAERLVAPTSQYASFAPNANGSIFVGASASEASPYILLLLRVARRELALCEHRSSDAAGVWPVFSPDSQRVFFQSDRDGKPAIYMADVQRLVERTEE